MGVKIGGSPRPTGCQNSAASQISTDSFLRLHRIEFFSVTVILKIVPTLCGQSSVSIASLILRKIFTAFLFFGDEIQRQDFFCKKKKPQTTRLPQSFAGLQVVTELQLFFMGTELYRNLLLKLRLTRPQRTFVSSKMSSFIAKDTNYRRHEDD